MEENKVATDSSAPNVPELTRLSGEQAEERTAREIRAKEWLRSILEMDGYQSTATVEERNELLLSECSRLARRVEELEIVIAKHSGCSHCNDSASGGIDK